MHANDKSTSHCNTMCVHKYYIYNIYICSISGCFCWGVELIMLSDIICYPMSLFSCGWVWEVMSAYQVGLCESPGLPNTWRTVCVPSFFYLAYILVLSDQCSLEVIEICANVTYSGNKRVIRIDINMTCDRDDGFMAFRNYVCFVWTEIYLNIGHMYLWHLFDFIFKLQ